MWLSNHPHHCLPPEGTESVSVIFNFVIYAILAVTKECSEGYVKCSNGQCLNKTSYCSGEVWCWNNAHVVSDTDCRAFSLYSIKVYCDQAEIVVMTAL